MLDLDEMPERKDGILRGGKFMRWGKHRTLVNGTKGDEVAGCIFVVENKEQEDALRMYEGANYEVVRCEVEIEGEAEQLAGLRFRFCGKGSVLVEE
jgi:hypothetical protein